MLIGVIFDIFDSVVEKLDVYTEYFIKYDKMINMIEERMNEKLVKHILNPKNRKERLNNYLIQPIQRIMRYRILLENIVRFLEVDNPVLEKGKSVILKISHYISFLNEERGRFESAEAAFMIQKKVKDCPADILNISRGYVMQVDTTSFNMSPSLSLFLYTDILLFTLRDGSPTRITSTTNNADKRTSFIFIKAVGLENTEIMAKKNMFIKVMIKEEISDRGTCSHPRGCSRESRELVLRVSSY
jgi:hypothetical protein